MRKARALAFAAITACAAAALTLAAPPPAARATLPPTESCTPGNGSPPTGPVEHSRNVLYVRSIPGEAGSLDPGGRRVGHYFYVTGSSHFSIYDIRRPLHPRLVSRVDFPCRFENEAVATNGRVLIYTDFATTGDLYVYDVRDKRHPHQIADVPNAGTHTMACLFACRYLYGSYHLHDRYGGLRGGEVVDLRNPHHPHVLGDWTAHGALPSHNVHWQYQVKPGFVLTSSDPIEYLDVRPGTRHSLLRPKVVARSDTPAGKRYHTAIWPRHGRDRYILASFETNGTPRCGLGSGDFSVFDTRGYARSHLFRRTDSYHLTNGTGVDGNPPANALGCSPHWFRTRPGWHDGGVVALGGYDNGLRFLRVDHRGRIHRAGHYLPAGAETSAAYWITPHIVYTVDYARGVDILRFK